MATKARPGTWVERELFESAAFLSLTGAAPQVLILFLGKRQFERQGRKKEKGRMICTNSENLIFTYAEATKKHGLTKPRFTRAIDELLEKGFICIAYQGGTCQGDRTRYQLSDNWRRWKNGMVLEHRQRDTVSRGYQDRKKSKVANVSVPIHAHESVPQRWSFVK